MSPTTDLASDTALLLERVASARAEHPSSRNVTRSTPGTGPQPGGRHLAAVKPIRPPAAPEAWSAGLWGSFA